MIGQLGRQIEIAQGFGRDLLDQQLIERVA